jgi:hypothetical protein
MMEISIKSRRPDQMRYKTCGDYYYVGSKMFLDVCDQKNEDMNFLIMIHELIEEHLTKRSGITEPVIMAHDLMFEKEREEGKHDEFAEPGEDPRSPYRDAHLFAEGIEKQICEKMGIDWNEYNENLIWD